MKRIAILLALLITSICMFAQNEHVKFMGIPLNGTIQQFHRKLVAKGCQLDAKFSSMISGGARAFNGSFADNHANIYVYYDESTKIVYRAKAVINCNGEYIRDIKFKDIKNLLDTKYGSSFSKKETHYGYDFYTYFVFSETSERMIGSVDFYVSENPYRDHEYSLHVDYYDNVNKQKHAQNRLDDI